VDAMDLGERGFESMNWIELAQDRVQWWVFVYAVMNHWIP
jgi:hypothetical protein